MPTIFFQFFASARSLVAYIITGHPKILLNQDANRNDNGSGSGRGNRSYSTSDHGNGSTGKMAAVTVMTMAAVRVVVGNYIGSGVVACSCK